MEKILYQINKYILLAILFLFPILVLSISPNPYEVPKLAILVFGLGVILIIKSVSTIIEGKLELSVSKYDFPVTLLGLSYLISTIIRTPNKMEALLLPGTTTAVLGGIFLYFLLNQLKENDKKVSQIVLVVSGVIYSLFIIFAFSGLFEKIPQLPAYYKARSFNPEAGYLPSGIFLLTLLPLGVGLVLSQKEIKNKILYALGCLVILGGLTISIFNMLPGKAFFPKFPDMNSSWQIAIDSLKASPVFGVGPGNFLTAFTRFRPLSFNQKDIWGLKFSTASDYYLTLFSEVGLLGLAAIILLIVTFYRNARRDFKELKLVKWGFSALAPLTSLTLLFILLALFPATNLLIVLIFIYLSLNVKTALTTLNLTTKPSDTAGQVASRFPAFLISVPVIALMVFVSFRAGIILSAEYKFKSALDALGRNEAKGTYDLMLAAIRSNPLVDRYRATFSRVNLVLANNITLKGKDLTDNDRTAITQLIQQAIQEGKATVALNPQRAANWESLGIVYQSIIPFAQGADAFAVQSYQQAIALDPINPNYRITLGGIYYAARNYDTASRVLELAVSAKPDLANAHYNLAFAYRDAGKIDAAIQQMTLVLSLVDPKSKDYDVAKQALDDLQSKKKTATPAATSNLTPPSGAQQPAVKPPITLPEGSQPPETPASTQRGELLTPTPAPQAGEPSPTPTP